MKKMIYVSFADYKSKAYLGVIKKIYGQLKVFEKVGIETTLVAQYGKGSLVLKGLKDEVINPNDGTKSPRRFIADTVAQMLQSGEYGCAYIRFQFFCNNVLAMLKNMKQNGLKVIMEIPTYPYEGELKLQGLKGIPKLLCDRTFRGACSKYIDRFALIKQGDGESIYDVPAFSMRNGLVVEDVKVSEYKYSQDELNIISMSSMMSWCGVERIIKGIAEYYSAGGSRKVVLHAVGDGIEKNAFETLSKDLGVEDKIIFYGALTGDELDKVFDKCSVGVCSISAHLKNMTEGTPLKTIEYVTRGLPIVTEINLWFVDENSDFCMRVPYDDSPLDIRQVTEFCDRVFENGTESAKKRIREIAEQSCDMSVSMKPAIDFFLK